MSAGLHVKRPIFMFGFIGSQFFSTDLVSSTVWSFMKSRQARDELLHADGRTDRRGRANIRSEGALAWVYVVISLCGRLPRWTRLLFSVRYALRLYATVAVVTSCVLCAVRAEAIRHGCRGYQLRSLCGTQLKQHENFVLHKNVFKNKLSVNFSDNCRRVCVLFRMWFDAVPADRRTASNSYIQVCLTQCAMSACASVACHIDSLTRNLAIMSHEGRAVVKSSTNGYAGGCHLIRIVISNTTVDCQTAEAGRNAACCVLGSPGSNSRPVRKFSVLQNVHSGCVAHSTSVMYRRVFVLA